LNTNHDITRTLGILWILVGKRKVLRMKTIKTMMRMRKLLRWVKIMRHLIQKKFLGIREDFRKRKF